MLPVLAQAPMAEEPATLPEPDTQSVHVVFDDIPDDRRRRKAINWAMRKSDGLIGGRNWGRAMCFNFEGTPDHAVLERALAKAKLTGEIREAEACDRPPVEAFLPPKAAYSRIVDVKEVSDVIALREYFSELLDRDLGLSAVRIDDEQPARLCLEFTEEPEDAVVKAAVEALPLELEAYEPTPDCPSAFAGTE